METAKKKSANRKKIQENKKGVSKKDGKVSKIWAAILANKGTGKIIDMKAVLK
jgi:hypothetical protein